jgi:hypothetical protein
MTIWFQGLLNKNLKQKSKPYYMPDLELQDLLQYGYNSLFYKVSYFGTRSIFDRCIFVSNEFQSHDLIHLQCHFLCKLLEDHMLRFP